MTLPPEEIQERMIRLKETLKRAGVKLTHQRLEVFREVAASKDHPDAENIYLGVRARVPTISLDTVYRTLGLLRDLGVVAALGPPRERVRYDGNVAAHHHFVCLECGAILDFECEAFDRLTIPAAVKHWGEIEKVQIEVRGRCHACARGNPQTK
jgi:Fur family peroxide stress response transcriptional regulator